MKKNLITFMMACLFPALSLALPLQLSGVSITGNQTISISTKSADRKALVVVFLSAFCPCSDSHIPELKKLAARHKDFRFVAVHSNANEPMDATKAYFEKAALPFDVISDHSGEFVNAFNALKTPHAYIVSPGGEILFQGGVTDSSHAPRASKFYLAEALDDLSQGKKIRTAHARALGCVIERKENQNVF